MVINPRMWRGRPDKVHIDLGPLEHLDWFPHLITVKEISRGRAGGRARHLWFDSATASDEFHSRFQFRVNFTDEMLISSWIFMGEGEGEGEGEKCKYGADGSHVNINPIYDAAISWLRVNNSIFYWIMSCGSPATTERKEERKERRKTGGKERRRKKKKEEERRRRWCACVCVFIREEKEQEPAAPRDQIQCQTSSHFLPLLPPPPPPPPLSPLSPLSLPPPAFSSLHRAWSSGVAMRQESSGEESFQESSASSAGFISSLPPAFITFSFSLTFISTDRSDWFNWKVNAAVLRQPPDARRTLAGRSGAAAMGASSAPSIRPTTEANDDSMILN